MSIKNNQLESKEYQRGITTGFIKGYARGMQDARLVIQDLMESNNLNLPDSEFEATLQVLKDEGTIQDLHEYITNRKD